MTNKRILGLDVSSSTVGWAIIDTIDDNVQFVKCGYFKPNKKGSILERLKQAQDKIQLILDEYKPDEIGIEEITKFMPKMSSANTIIALAVFNRSIGLTCLNYLGKSPEMFSVMAMRHGLKATKKFPSKEQMPALVEKHLEITFPYEYKKTGSIKSETYDMADATIVAMYYAFMLNGKLEQIKKERKK